MNILYNKKTQTIYLRVNNIFNFEQFYKLIRQLLLQISI